MLPIQEETQIPNRDVKKTGIVLIHGLTGTPTEMKPLEKYLRKLGFDVENVLLAGHGGSNEQMFASNWQQWLESARDGLKNILKRNDQAVLCGLSMGAIISAKLASEEEKVAGTMMLSPTLAYDGSVSFGQLFDSLIHSRTFQRSMRKIIEFYPPIGQKIFWEEVAPYGIRDERIQRQITKSIEAAKKGGSNEFGVFRTYYGSLSQMWSLIDEAQKHFSNLKCPVLMVHSLNDTLASIHNATTTYSQIGSENKSLVMLSGCDHVMTLDLQKQKVMKLLSNFLNYVYSEQSKSAHVSSVVASALTLNKNERPDSEITFTLSNEFCSLTREEWKQLNPDKNYPLEKQGQGISSEQSTIHSLIMRSFGKPVLSLPIFTSNYQLASLSNKGPQPVLQAAQKILPSIFNPKVLGLAYRNREPQGIAIDQSWLAESNPANTGYLTEILESVSKASKAHLFATPLESLKKEGHLSAKNLPQALEASQAKSFTHKNEFVNWLLQVGANNLAYLPQNEFADNHGFDEALASIG